MKTLFKNTYDEISYKWDFLPKQEKEHGQAYLIEDAYNVDKHNDSYIIEIDVDEIEDNEKAIDYTIKCSEEDATNKDFLINYIANNKVYEGYSKSIIKRIAGKTNDVSNKACMQIVSSCFQEPIFEDIAMDVYIKLIELINNDHCYLEYQEKENGYLIKFANDINDKEKTFNHYNDLYKSVRKTLSVYAGNSGRQVYKTITEKDGTKTLVPITIQNYDAIALQEDKNGNTYEQLLTTASPLYVQNVAYEGAIDDLLNNLYFNAFMFFVKVQTRPKKYSELCLIMHGLLKGYISEEIAKKTGLSLDKVKKGRRKLKDLYLMAKNADFSFECGKDYTYMHGVKNHIDYGTFSEYKNIRPIIKLDTEKDYRQVKILDYRVNYQYISKTKAYRTKSDLPEAINIEYQETGYNSRCSFLNAIINQEIDAENAYIESCKQELEYIRKNYKEQYEKHVLNLHYIKSDFIDDHKTTNTNTMQEGKKEGRHEKKYIIDYRRNKLVVWYYYFNDEGKIIDTEIIREYPIVDKEVTNHN